MHDKKPLQPTQVECPGCGTTVEWTKQSTHRPFCSEHCRNRDFIDWANEQHRVPGSGEYADIFGDDLS